MNRISIPFLIATLSLSSLELAADPYIVEGLQNSTWIPIENGSTNLNDSQPTYFGRLQEGTRRIRQYRVTNQDPAPLTVIGITSSEPEFTADSFSQTTLLMGESTTFKIEFTATLRTVTPQITIDTGAAGDFSQFDFLVYGQGIPRTPRVLYVDATATGTGDGGSWEDAFVYLQDALVASSAEDEIHIAEGVYYPDEGSDNTDGDRESSFVVPHDVSLMGAYRSGGSRQQEPTLFTTVLSGDLQQDDLDPNGDLVTGSADEILGDNAFTVVTLLGKADLSALTITAGSADEENSPVAKNRSGGGIFAELSPGEEIRLSIKHCDLIGCRSADAGSGLYLVGGTPWMDDCEFSGNQSGAGGAACRIADPVGFSIIRQSRFGTNAAIIAAPEFTTAADLYISGSSFFSVSGTTFSGHRGAASVCKLEDIS